jgi:hypothetical protein
MATFETIVPGCSKRRSRALRRVALAQSAFYVTTGLWPLLSLPSFEKVTGPKADKWLVRTVGVLVASIGAGLGLAARRGTISPEVRTIGLLSAAGFATMELYYVLRRRISAVYLLDAAAEATLVAGWMRAR